METAVMPLLRPLCLLALAAAAHSAMAGSIAVDYFSELDGSFNPGLPGRVPLLYDQSGTSFTDIGVNAFSDSTDGRITSVAQVDINNADTNLVGIGLARHLYNGTIDTSFQGTGKRVKDAFLTSVVDACRDPNGRIVVAGMTPGANGSAGNKDLALVRFNADGSDDLSFAGDGGVAFSRGDDAVDHDEAIRDVDCLANGNILIAGWYDDGDARFGFVAEMPSDGTTPSLRSYVFGASSGGTATFTSAAEIDSGIVATAFLTGTSAYGKVFFLSPGPGNYVATASRSPFDVGGGITIPKCLSFAEPQLFGVAMLAPGDYVFSGIRKSGGINSPFVMRAQFGEQLLVNCTPVDNGVDNAYVTPPVTLSNHVFVAAGFQPFGSGPLTSRLSGLVAPANGGALAIAPGFGIAGLAQWSFPYQTASANNNRSFVQRLYLDPAYSLMAVGTRVWNGNDTDVAITRLGSQGLFNNGFETPIE